MSTSNPPPHFIVFVPGWMGSKLRHPATHQWIWGDFTAAWLDPKRWLADLRYPSPLEPAGYLDRVVLLRPVLGFLDSYQVLIDHLKHLGYAIDPDAPTPQPAAYTFPYDWRQDNRLSARLLKQAIDGWRVRHPGAEVWVLAHSNGGVVARWYIEQEGGRDHVRRLFLLGSPRDGTPHALWALLHGLEAMLRPGMLRLLPDLMVASRAVVRTFPSAYQLIPYHQSFLRDELTNTPLNPFDGAWAETDHERELLEDARQFNKVLGAQTSVPTTCLFGRRKATVSAGEVLFGAGGRWRDIRWGARAAGDGTIPEWSGAHLYAEAVLPLEEVSHTDLCVHPTTLGVLTWELQDKYRQPTMAVALTGTHRVEFEPARPAYRPGEALSLWATVQTLGQPPAPASEAVIEVRLTWREPLVGEATARPADPPSIPLWADEARPGHYAGEGLAPATPGVYQLTAVVRLPGAAPLELHELIAVDQLADAPAEEAP